MEEIKSNFLHEIIDSDLAEGRETHVHTRWPPEPNAYIHVGSAKAIWINWETAKKYGGKFNLRMDDTNPAKEEPEYVESIIKDVEWLIGEKPSGGLFYGSDYFDKCYEYALLLIDRGLAFVCDLSADELRETRGTLTEPGKNSPYRDRSAGENRDLFERMRAGEFPDGSRTLRAKIDMASPNIYMRDPVIYRIMHVPHYRQGDKWCIYPMYDYAHPIQDATEGITHSMCSYEFVNHRPLYDWVVDNIGFDRKPHQYEFSRLNITYTVMSKRYLLNLIKKGLVDGWDDPRLPTLCALRRRGFTPSSILTFVRTAGVAKAMYSSVDSELLDHCIREELNQSAPRRMAVLEPLKLIIENYPEDKTEYFDLPNHPQKPGAGVRKLPFTRELFIEKSDFEEIPPPKFHRLKPGGEVRLMGAYIVKYTGVDRAADGTVTAVRGEYDPATGGVNPPDGRKVKGTIHWLSAAHAADASVNLYEKLFTLSDMSNMPEGKDYEDFINPDSLKRLENCKIEPSVSEGEPYERWQFVRNGYFIRDSNDKDSFNRIVGLKDSFIKSTK